MKPLPFDETMARTPQSEFTVITGYRRAAPSKPPGGIADRDALVRWIGSNFRIYQLPGFLSATGAVAYAASMDIDVHEISHVCLDHSGQGMDCADQRVAFREPLQDAPLA